MSRVENPGANSGFRLVKNAAWAGLGVVGLGGVLFASAMFTMFAIVAWPH